MSFYLDNLAARTFGPQHAIQPQLPSLFATPTNPMAWREHEPRADSFETLTEEQVFNEIESQSTRSALHAFGRGMTQGSDDLSEPFGAQLKPSIRSGEGQVLPTQINSQSLTTISDSPLQFSAASPSPRFSHEKAGNVSRPGAKKTQEEGATLFPAQTLRALAEALAEHEATSTPQAPSLKHPISPEQNLQIASTSGAYGSKHTPANLKSRLEPMVSFPVKLQITEDRKPEPTIRVNIGRIEVRAVMPSAPAPRPKRPRAGPMLSLEDYLKQRNGRQR